MLKDNLLSKSDLIKYLLDDFKVNLKDIKKIIVTSKTNNSDLSGFKFIPHHRYSLYFNDSLGILRIYPTEGLLRTDHIKVEIELLQELYDHNVEYEEDFIDTQSEVNRLYKLILKHSKGDIDGIIIGSLWNFNFILNSKIREKFLDKTIQKLDKQKLNTYLDYRLNLIAIEDCLFDKVITISNEDLNIFSEGEIPTEYEIMAVSCIAKKYSKVVDLKALLKNDKLLTNYLIVDYIFFNDLVTGNNLFKKTTDFPETLVIKDHFLSFQILSINNQKYINFSWANPKALSAIIKLIGTKHLYVYGKCGSLSNHHKLGQIIAPSDVFYKDDKISFLNSVSDIVQVPFCCVDSPLLETKKWLNNMRKHQVECVDMELYELVKSVDDDSSKYFIYYISDQPDKEFNLANRFSFVRQRIKCTEMIANHILSTK